MGLSLLSASIMFAQTITSSDFGNVGDQVYMGMDQTPGVSVGASGSGQTWDFSSLNTETLDTLFFLNPTTLPNSSNYPTANLAIASNEGVFFFEKTSSAVYNLGFYFAFGPIASDVQYNPPFKYLEFPASLSTSFSTQSSFAETSYLGVDTNILTCQITIDSAMLVRHTNMLVTFDASGSLQLPTGTYSSVLRAYSEEQTRDSVFIFAPNPINCPPFLNIPSGWSLAPDFLLQLINPNLAGVMLDTNRIYTWYANGEKFGLCAIDVNHSNAPISARFKSDASQIGLGMAEESMIAVSVFPNPTEGMISIQSETNLANHTFRLTDLQGRIVFTTIMQSMQQIQLPLLPTGLYVYEITDGDRVVNRGKIAVK